MSEPTVTFSLGADHAAQMRTTLGVVYDALREKGYDPVSQIVGYILSGDPTYITSHKDARSIIKKFDRDELMEEIITSYIGDL